MASRISRRRRTDSVIASPSARKTRRTGWPLRATAASSASISANGFTRNFFCGSVYISQKVQRFQEQPLVTCRIRLRASDGGRKTGSM